MKIDGLTGTSDCLWREHTEPKAASERTRKLSIATLFKMAFQGVDLGPLRQALGQRLQVNFQDAGAWMDLSVVEQLSGNGISGLVCQREALKLERIYQSSWRTPTNGLRVLAFMLDGEINSNTPVDFLLEGTNVVLYSLYLSQEYAIPDDLPEHDVAIVAISESDRARPILRWLQEEVLPGWTCPVLNWPKAISQQSRDELYRQLSGAPGLYMPPTIRIKRSALHQLGDAAPQTPELMEAAPFGLIVRPVASHAGLGLEKLVDRQSIDSYLLDHPEDEFFISPFVDYRSGDGLFRKYRIMWIDGRPYPAHMAIAEEWKVWYLNAHMEDCDWKRAEEERFLSTFDDNFGKRHAQALKCISERSGLDYFGVDCGELPDGRLLVFEGSIALVVHDMDSPEVFPYKSPQMQRLFNAFYRMLWEKSQSGSGGCQ